MKNLKTISLNIAYWFVYLINLSLVYNAIYYPTMVFFPMVPDPEIFSALGSLVIIPSVLAFYIGYSFFFTGFFLKRKYLQLTLVMVALSFMCFGLMLFLSSFIRPVSPEGFPIFSHMLQIYGLHFVFLSLVQCSAGLILKGFLTWLNSASPAQEISATRI